MGSFWGLDNAGKEAEGWPREYGAWNKDQYKGWLDQQNRWNAAGADATDWSKNWNLKRADTGTGTPQQIDAYGRQIMPGLDNYIDQSNSHLDSIINSWDSSGGKAGDVMNTINPNVAKVQGLADTTSSSNSGLIGDTWTGKNAAMLDAYGGENQYEDTGNKDINTQLQLLIPGGEFQTARVARSYAPMMAQTLNMMRNRGIDPGTGQGLEAAQRVMDARARGMDDATGAAVGSYVGAKNAETVRDLQNKQGVLEAATNRRTSNYDDFAREKLAESQANWARQNDAANRADQAALLNRGMTQQDWLNKSNLVREQTSNDLQNLQLENQRYGLGAQYNLQNLAEQDAGAAGVGQYGWNSVNQANTSARNALAAGDTAEDAYKTAYGYEAPKAGWGAKMIGSMVGPALAMIPGLGPVASTALSMVGQAAGAAGAAQGAYGAGAGGGGGGGGWPGGMGGMPNFAMPGGGGGWPGGMSSTPYSMNYNDGSYSSSGTFDPLSSLKAWNPNYYDPSRSMSLDPGTFQVER